MAFAGVRSDPFFFDLLGFLGSVKGQGTRTLNDGNQSDFFVGLNTLAIVVELPNAAIGGTGTNVGVWATTSLNGMQADQMGRPAINTVFNGTAADKEAFNVTAPAAQPTAMGGAVPHQRHRDPACLLVARHGARLHRGPGRCAGRHPPAGRHPLHPRPMAAGPLNGRGLADDVIDAELNIVTGGFAFAGRNGVGAIPTDGVGPHGDYLPDVPVPRRAALGGAEISWPAGPQRPAGPSPHQTDRRSPDAGHRTSHNLATLPATRRPHRCRPPGGRGVVSCRRVAFRASSDFATSRGSRAAARP